MIANDIKKLLLPETNKEIDHIFDNNNMTSLKLMCLFTAVIEGISLIISFLIRIENIHYDLSTILMTSTICACLLTAFLADLFLKEKIHGHLTSVIIASLFFTIMAVFGIFVSYMNYIAGRQMIIFYAVNICFVNFIHIYPMFQLVFLLVEHIVFFSILYSYDGLQSIILPNVVIYLLIVLVSSIVSFHREYDFVSSSQKAQMLAQDFIQKSSQDQLTGLMNRYVLDSIQDISKGTTCQIAMADIDYFKTFNDTYGHLKGDEVLKVTASSLLDVFRRTDCYRYGGDEFLVLTTSLNEDTFRDRLAIWENKLSEVRLEGINESIKISYGVASGVVNSKEDIFKLIKEADKKLYAIKEMRHHRL